MQGGYLLVVDNGEQYEQTVVNMTGGDIIQITLHLINHISDSTGLSVKKVMKFLEKCND